MSPLSPDKRHGSVSHVLEASRLSIRSIVVLFVSLSLSELENRAEGSDLGPGLDVPITR